MTRLLPSLVGLFVLALGSDAQGSVSGELRYLDRVFTYGKGFTGEEVELPAPRTRVQVLDAASESVLGTAYTDLDGRFEIAITGSGPSDVLVRAFTLSDDFGGSAVRVQDLAGDMYSTTSPVLAVPDLSAPFDAGVIVAPKVVGPGYVGGPFGLLHQAVRAVEYVQAQGETGLPSPVEMVWPVAGGSFAQGTTVYVQDDDGFDDVVVLHELGHVIHELYSDSDSPGGPHSFAQSDQDPRLSLGEGWASFFAGAVRRHWGDFRPGYYLDCDGSGVTGPASVQLRMRFEDGAPFSFPTGGEADEGAVFCALWDLLDDVDTDDLFPGDDDLVDGSFEIVPGMDADAVHWAAFTGDEVLGAPALHVVDLWDGYFVDAGATHYDELSLALEAWKIRVREDAAEPDDTLVGARPWALGESWSETRTLYASPFAPPVPGNGDVDVWALDVPADAIFEVETRYPDGLLDAETYADTFLTIYAPDGQLLLAVGGGGAGRNAKADAVAAPVGGTYFAEVRAETPTRPTGSYQLRARQIGVVGPPDISSVVPSSVPTLEPGASNPLTVSGLNLTDFSSVTIGGVPAAATAQPDGTLQVLLPQVDQVGTLDLVVTAPTGSGSYPIEVSPPSTPVLNVLDGLPLWFSFLPLDVQVAAQPGDVGFVFASLSGEPTVVPGVLDLDIGGGLTGLVLLEALALGGGGVAGFSLSVASAPVGVPIHVQAGVVSGATLAPPLLATNEVVATKSN